MALEIEQNQTQRRTDAQQDTNPLSQLVQPLLKIGLEHFSFGVMAAAVKELHLEDASLFANVRDSGGLTLPSVQSMLLDRKIEERATTLQLAA
jgi:hypothetical protein